MAQALTAHEAVPHVVEAPTASAAQVVAPSARSARAVYEEIIGEAALKWDMPPERHLATEAFGLDDVVGALQKKLSWLAARSDLDAWAIALIFRDVAVYLDVARPVREEVLDCVLQAVPDSGEVVLVSHSLGTVVALNLDTRLSPGSALSTRQAGAAVVRSAGLLADLQAGLGALPRRVRQVHSRHSGAVCFSVGPDSADSAMGGPQRPGAAGHLDDQSRQFRFVGDRERDISAPATADRSVVGLRGEVTVREEPDVECGQLELFTTSSVGPAERLRDRDVDRQSTHLQVAAHGRMISRTAPGRRAKQAV
ncbi:hypothetical protein [Streptomyces sp. SAI-149]|uniref:hypothetical protein n=1 Tax=unclassified Streptomyces TaxID=2593676 RepID=UPI002472F1B3|nr:hypothetical protein [Streptomyces sp. SAI-149]MDH6493827.1 hypothetical protein [Streptomyces sp. SAI-149]